MAFKLENLNKVSTGANSKCFNIFSYEAGLDMREHVESEGYFDTAQDGINGTGRFKLNDWISVTMSGDESQDEVQAIYKVTDLSPHLVVEQIDLTIPQPPSDIVARLIHVGTFVPNAAGTLQTINITGILTTDHPLVMLNQADEVPALSCRIASNGVLSVAYSEPAGAGTNLATYFIFRDN